MPNVGIELRDLITVATKVNINFYFDIGTIWHYLIRVSVPILALIKCRGFKPFLPNPIYVLIKG